MLMFKPDGRPLSYANFGVGTVGELEEVEWWKKYGDNLESHSFVSHVGYLVRT